MPSFLHKLQKPITSIDRLVGLKALSFITTLLPIVAPCLQLSFSEQYQVSTHLSNAFRFQL